MQAASIKEIAALTTLGQSTIWREVAAGRFPKPAKICGRSVFDVAEIEAFLAARFAERDVSRVPAHA